jgi:hypothetical protein
MAAFEVFESMTFLMTTCNIAPFERIHSTKSYMFLPTDGAGMYRSNSTIFICSSESAQPGNEHKDNEEVSMEGRGPVVQWLWKRKEEMD